MGCSRAIIIDDQFFNNGGPTPSPRRNYIEAVSVDHLVVVLRLCMSRSTATAVVIVYAWETVCIYDRNIEKVPPMLLWRQKSEDPSHQPPPPPRVKQTRSSSVRDLGGKRERFLTACWCRVDRRRRNIHKTQFL